MDQSDYQVGASIHLLRLILRPIFRGLFHLLSSVRIYGKENIPKSGAYLIAINHISLFEPPFILAFWPIAPEAAGAVDIWDRTGQNVLVRLYGGIPVHRGEYDRKLIETLLSVLRSGKPLLIAPEGGRSHHLGMRRALPGAAYLANAANVPILPVGIVGTSDDFLREAFRGRRPRLEMHIGKNLLIPYESNKDEVRHISRQKNADLIMMKIAELIPAEYHGVYSNTSMRGENVDYDILEVERNNG